MNINQTCQRIYPVNSVLLTDASTSQNAFEIDVQVCNMLCVFSLPLHIDLRLVAMNTANVTYRRNSGFLVKQNRNPTCLIRVFSTGKVCILGCRSEEECRTVARQVGRLIQRSMGKLNVKMRLLNYHVSNILATCKMPFGIKIEEMAKQFPQSSYEPELSVGLTWRSEDPKATLRIHTTGSVTVTGATSEKNVVTVIQNIYPILKRFSCLARAGGDSTQKPAQRKRVFQTPMSYNCGNPSANLYSSKRSRTNMTYAGGSNRANGLSVRSSGSSAESAPPVSVSGMYGDKMYFSDEEELYEEFGWDDLDADFS